MSATHAELLTSDSPPRVPVSNLDLEVVLVVNTAVVVVARGAWSLWVLFAVGSVAAIAALLDVRTGLITNGLVVTGLIVLAPRRSL